MRVASISGESDCEKNGKNTEILLLEILNHHNSRDAKIQFL